MEMNPQQEPPALDRQAQPTPPSAATSAVVPLPSPEATGGVVVTVPGTEDHKGKSRAYDFPDVDGASAGPSQPGGEAGGAGSSHRPHDGAVVAPHISFVSAVAVRNDSHPEQRDTAGSRHALRSDSGGHASGSSDHEPGWSDSSEGQASDEHRDGTGNVGQFPEQVQGVPRPTHTRAKSLLASSNLHDFFRPNSVASAATAASSAYFGSPQEASDEQRKRSDSQGDGASGPDRLSPIESRQGSPSPPSEHGSAMPTQQRGTGDVYDLLSLELLDYSEEALPDYEEAPAYLSAPGVDERGSPRSAVSGFRAAAATRLLSSRLAQTLRIPNARRREADRARTSVTTTPYNEPAATPATAGTAISTICRPIARSDSAPELLRIRRRPVVVRAFAATDFVQGARMGPAPRRTTQASSSQSPASTEARRVMPAAVQARLRTSASSTFPLRNFAASLTASGPHPGGGRSQPASRPASRVASYSNTNGGLFTCGYSVNRSGASTPSRPAQGSKSRSSSLRDLSSLLFHRRRDDGLPDQEACSTRDPNAEPSASESVSQTPSGAAAVSPPVSSEDEAADAREAETFRRGSLANRRSMRPNLMRAAYSSPHASVVTDAAEQSWLVSPVRSTMEPCHLAKLPRELIIECLRALIDLHVREHQREVESGRWRGTSAMNVQWVGAEKAVRELARFERVSRDWQSYVLDGQLWRALDVSCYPHISEACLVRIGRSARPFVKRLDLHGLARLSSASLEALFGIQPDDEHLQATAWSSLEELDLQGCNSLTAASLERLLGKMPALKKLNLSGLACITDETCKVLREATVQLQWLDISRCPNVSGSGICALATGRAPGQLAGAERQTASPFKALRAAGVRISFPKDLAVIGKQWPNLEELDLSYTRIDNQCIQRLVSSDGDAGCEESDYHVALTPRQVGVEADEPIYRRKFPSLRKLKLGSCPWLTDAACAHLAHAVPNLEVLELSCAGSGASGVRDGGLLMLLPTIPRLQKLDLEGASNITDSVLAALTPPESHAEAYGAAAPLGGATVAYDLTNALRLRGQQASLLADWAPPAPYNAAAIAALVPATGTHLTHLVLSSAKQVTAAALMLLIRRCPHLRHLEVDDTPAGDSVAREFVHLARQRKARDAYISLVDCRGLTRGASQELASLEGADGGTRPRCGQRGWAFRHFYYDDADAAAIDGFSASPSKATSSQNRAGKDVRQGADVAAGPTAAALRAALGQDECNRNKVVLKSFYAWESVDARKKARRRAEAKAAKRNKQRLGSVVSMALALGSSSGGSSSPSGSGSSGSNNHSSATNSNGDNGARNATVRQYGSLAARNAHAGSVRDRSSRSGRWSRILSPVGSDDDDDDDDDDPRGCVVA
ncbi:hypothetical protein ACQY0O_007806 [Thecaphora frezii]